MKYVFALCFLLIAAVGLGLHLTKPDLKSEIPVIYWVIDPAPARDMQIALFHQWQIKHGHGKTYRITSMDELRDFRGREWTPPIREAMAAANPAGEAIWSDSTSAADLPIEVRAPVAEMRLDAASNDLDKKLIQGVSGVAGDVIEAYGGGNQMQYLAAAGMLADVTESAQELGFGPDKTYPALAPALFYDGRQYAFPRNPAQTLYWVHKDTFARYDQPLPPLRWTVEEFEERGRAFVDAANEPGQLPRVFFADRALRTELRRSLGLSYFNETMTACTLDDPRNARVLGLIHKWTFEDRILPSAADRASFDTQGGWGGPAFQLFKSGRYAMFASGRWALMLFRQFGAMPLAVVEPPHAGMPNTILSGGQSTVFRASPHLHAAKLFLAYMAGEDYNMQIVRDGDALPPNPKYTDTELFLRPPDHPNEWGCHEVYARAATEVAIVQSFSPFVLPVIVERFDQIAEDEVMNNRATPEEAGAKAAGRINEEIQRSLTESAMLRSKYEEWCARQEQIDRIKAEGRKIPAGLITNPFHLAWYRHRGMLDESDNAALSPAAQADRDE